MGRGACLVLALALASGTFNIGIPAPAAAEQRLCDPGFEAPAGPDCWTFTGDPGDPSAATTGFPRTGAYSAELCGVDGCEANVTQSYVIPENVVKATLKFWFTSFTTDSTCGDNLYALVSDQTNFIPNPLTYVCSGEGGNGTWSQRAIDATAFFKGRSGVTVLIALGAVTNGQHPTSWHVDDVSLNVVTQTNHPREANLELREHLVAKGRVTGDGYEPCVTGVKVKVQRRGAERWRTVATTTTIEDGRYRVRLPDRPGRYRAVVPRIAVNDRHACQVARSANRSHSH